MTGHVRVLLYASSPKAEPDAVHDIYHQVSQRLAGTPGLLKSELLQDVSDACDFVIMSEWSSLTAFRTWDDGPDHTSATAPLRPYHNHHGGYGRAFGIYQVTAEYRALAPAEDDEPCGT